MGDGGSRGLFRYLVADESDDYVAVMDYFIDVLLADATAADIAATLTAGGHRIDRDVAENRCRQLVAWGNLGEAGRDTRVGSIGDYVRATARYRPTVLGGRVHREATALLSSHDGPSEVTRESLARIYDALTHIDAAADTGFAVDPNTLAGHVTGVFVHHNTFTDSIADFYTYLAETSGQPDLSGEDYTEFKLLLLDYIDVITSDLSRYATRICVAVQRLLPHIDDLLTALPDAGLPSGTVTRSPGRTRDEWEQLASWYDEDAGPRQLRDAAATALNRLLTHTRNRTSDAPGFSHRADLLRLASWFSESSDEQAHRLHAATFGAYPSRHLLLGPDEPDPRIGAGTSWWNADPVSVPISLRERGDRSPRGRNARIPDPTADRSLIVAMAEQESDELADAVAELRAANDLHGAQISTPARDVLLDRLAVLLARHQELDGVYRIDDHDLGLTLTAEPGRDTTVHCPDGDLTVHGLILRTSSPLLTPTDAAPTTGVW
ncbi:DUF2397 domain-containing protein [Rhodococcus artemisiae]|uniref:DUF2397 domain-containing protein n=1 Tax=Rhodococcus artemisiae TaxID=714159 RepID=A0ABU7LGZ7_9NOCA|nr:DUF2397 domain-containing protein [Rhodococcus artemisiae]MEE2060829.1 DUF2397 domain-containing protein [Rhodococcus artemisiae]